LTTDQLELATRNSAITMLQLCSPLEVFVHVAQSFIMQGMEDINHMHACKLQMKALVMIAGTSEI
jgi:hypothetical protein